MSACKAFSPESREAERKVVIGEEFERPARLGLDNFELGVGESEGGTGRGDTS
jgi:hypothetical protein